MGHRGCRHRCFGALAMPWRLRARFNSRGASSPSWTLGVSMRQNWGASGEQGARGVPGREERLSRSPSGDDSEELSAPKVLRQEKVATGSQGGADPEELSSLRRC